MMNQDEREKVAREWRSRLRLLEPSDYLWLGLVAQLRINIEDEIEALCRPGVSDAEAHRGRGRLGMLIDLQEQFDAQMNQAHSLPEP